MDKDALLAWYQEIGIYETTASAPENKLTHPVQVAARPAAPPWVVDENKSTQQAQPRIPHAIVALTSAPSPSIIGSNLPIRQDAAFATPDLARIQTLEELRAAMENFEGCDLKKTALHTVFCDGVQDAKIMVIGEAPGADEDRLGKPFVGLSGQLLDLMFAAIGLSRETNLYITNTIPWRPPGNRDPTAQELRACLGFLHRHIALAKPELVILVGGISAKNLLGSQSSMSQLRGQIHALRVPGVDREIPAFAIYHPAYLLRSPGQKRSAWRDLLILKRFLKERNICD